MSKAVLTINSRNYGAWSLRSWLICRMSGLDFDEVLEPADDPRTRAELLQLSPSFLVPSLEHDGVKVWDTMAIAEHLQEIMPTSALLPADPVARGQCRSISGELHAGFQGLRSALPMNIKRHHHGFKVWAGARADIDRVVAIWAACLDRYRGPWLFGEYPTLADAMFAPEVTRFVTYDVDLPEPAGRYVGTIMSWPDMKEWIAVAESERDDLSELDVEF